MEYKNMMLAESRNGNTEAVKQLLEAGTDVNAKNNLGDTPLMWAARYGHTETVKLLLESSADVNANNNGSSPSRVGNFSLLSKINCEEPCAKSTGRQKQRYIPCGKTTGSSTLLKK